MIWRSWFRTPVGSNLGCIALLSQSYLNQKYKLPVHQSIWEPVHLKEFGQYIPLKSLMAEWFERVLQWHETYYHSSSTTRKMRILSWSIIYHEKLYVRLTVRLLASLNWPTGWGNACLTDQLIDRLLDWLIDQLINQIFDWLIDWLIVRLLDWVTDQMTDKLLVWSMEWFTTCGAVLSLQHMEAS